LWQAFGFTFRLVFFFAHLPKQVKDTVLELLQMRLKQKYPQWKRNAVDYCICNMAQPMDGRVTTAHDWVVVNKATRGRSKGDESKILPLKYHILSVANSI
jgi:hypothetical protein